MSYIRTDDDIRLYVQDLAPTTGIGQTVVFVHGWPFDHTLFEYQAVPIVNLGYRCVGIDLRGFGRSDTGGRGYNYDQMSDDLYRVVRTMNLRNFTLVGFSMGAGVCARYMRRHQGYCVSQLCFIGAALPQFAQSIQNPAGVPASSISQLLGRLERDRPATLADFAQSCFYLPHSDSFMTWLDNSCFAAGATAVNSCLIALRDENCRTDLAAIAVPTAIFHGQQDQICPVDMARLTQQLIPGSMLHIYSECGHCCHIDRIELFNQHFVNFLARE